jgi:hypothetical protein
MENSPRKAIKKATIPKDSISKGTVNKRMRTLIFAGKERNSLLNIEPIPQQKPRTVGSPRNRMRIMKLESP